MARSLQGTNLWRDPRTGVYVYRRTDPVTGRRYRKSTGTKVLEHALRTAAEFEGQRDLRKVGLTVLDNWLLDLRPLAEEWLQAQAGGLCPAFASQKRMRVLRALDLLGLKRARDLDDVARVHDRLLALPRFTKSTKRRAFQDVLRQFSGWLAANKRYLDRDPLQCWAPISTAKEPKRRRRALLPAEMARALRALDRLDAHHERHPQRPLIMAILVSGQRVGAVVSRDVEHLDVKQARLDVGPGSGKKRRGAATLDPVTLGELRASVGERTQGPLFLAARGGRPAAGKVRTVFLEAFGLGLVEELWPAGEERRGDLSLLTSLMLLRGGIPSVAGNPTLVRDETREQHAELEQRVVRIAAGLETEWRRRMAGVDIHALRKTHRSWAQARGVPPVVIDKQLGHADPGEFEVMRALGGSETGRKHYLDLSSELFDPQLSAAAVRALLDEALRSTSPRNGQPDAAAR